MTPKTRSPWGLDPTSCPITKPVRNWFTSSPTTHRTFSNTIQVFGRRKSRCWCRRCRRRSNRSRPTRLTSSPASFFGFFNPSKQKNQSNRFSSKTLELVGGGLELVQSSSDLDQLFRCFAPKSHILDVSAQKRFSRSSTDDRSRRHLGRKTSDASFQRNLKRPKKSGD